MAGIKKWNIYFLLFEYVEVLDFSGSFDVFSMANVGIRSSKKETDFSQGEFFKLHTVSETGGTVTALHGLKIEADYSFKNCPIDEMDLLIIPGASPAYIKDFIAKNPQVIEWLADRLKHVPVVASVCVGALILAEAGGFDGEAYGPTLCTTHHGAIDDLEAILEKRSADARVMTGARYVDNTKSENPRILSSAGVSAGIDQAFYILREILGNPTLAATTATVMEYNQTQNWVYGPFVKVKPEK